MQIIKSDRNEKAQPESGQKSTLSNGGKREVLRVKLFLNQRLILGIILSLNKN
jgi:hypothetical protein